MNNIFNPNEFDLFGKGEIIMPDKVCQCFYKGKCVLGESCMKDLPYDKVFAAVERVLVNS